VRQSFPEVVEKGRERAGRFASEPGEKNGAAKFQHPRNGAWFVVIFSDGTDWQELGLPGPPWEHVSVHVIAKGRTPTWAEMCWVKGLFWGDEECVVQFHPPKSRYVNTHDEVLHLWRVVGVDFPAPPLQCV
jgi:hypothetical protein